MPLFILICGTPASGKSSVAKMIAEDVNAVILSFKEIRKEANKKEEYGSVNEKVRQILRIKLREKLMSGDNIVLDAINRVRSERKEYVYWAKMRGYDTICVYCTKDYDYAIYANSMRNKMTRVSEDIIIKNYNLFIPPDESEGWDEIYINDGNKYSVEIERQKVKAKKGGEFDY
jgi:predicted kinase